MIRMREIFMHRSLCRQKIYKRKFGGIKGVVVHCIHIQYIKKT
jgi:hypothetical protein